MRDCDKFESRRPETYFKAKYKRLHGKCQKWGEPIDAPEYRVRGSQQRKRQDKQGRVLVPAADPMQGYPVQCLGSLLRGWAIIPEAFPAPQPRHWSVSWRWWHWAPGLWVIKHKARSLLGSLTPADKPWANMGYHRRVLQWLTLVTHTDTHLSVHKNSLPSSVQNTLQRYKSAYLKLPGDLKQPCDWVRGKGTSEQTHVSRPVQSWPIKSPLHIVLIFHRGLCGRQTWRIFFF